MIPQDVDIPIWQTNQMISYEVIDLGAWGLEIHVIDPAGVCWHVRQVELPRIRFGLVAPQFVVDEIVATAGFYRDVLGFTNGDYFLDSPVHVILARAWGMCELVVEVCNGLVLVFAEEPIFPTAS